MKIWGYAMMGRMLAMMVVYVALSLLVPIGSAHAQQPVCNWITDQHLTDMQLDRAALSTDKMTISKELYGTGSDLERVDCFYTKQGFAGPRKLVLLSLASVPTAEDERQILSGLADLAQKMQAAIGEPSPSNWIKYSASQIEGGWCSDSVSAFSPPIAGCCAVRNGRFLTLTIFDSALHGPNTDIRIRVKKYFEAAFANATSAQ